ncbi:DUF1853 family protein [Tamlana sp. I1]|uniref:DUF1853 family protein n=1 Tax=Tamlana sp. I1 TaxID=2762061 RepID=UPI00188FB24A|nr:DUF1853 family protein [Tamlana sp. I1]
MHHKSTNIQLQYQGYLNTPLLWEGHDLLGLKQFSHSKQPTAKFRDHSVLNLRLGKRVEQFVFSELKAIPGIEMLLENTQIQKENQTIGEIDCILKQGEQPVHLEIIYKFYLFDPNYGNTEIDHWIGPNRNDSLVKKLEKLKDKQLPLLYNAYTVPVLKALSLKPEAIVQNVYFKAQLFTPYNKSVAFKLLNKKCIQGFYIHLSEIQQFSNCKFYIPNKLDWLQETHNHVEWLKFPLFKEKITPIINQKIAPLCWIKYPNGMIEKFFVVWWD